MTAVPRSLKGLQNLNLSEHCPSAMIVTPGDDWRTSALLPSAMEDMKLALVETWMQRAESTFHTWTRPLNRNYG